MSVDAESAIDGATEQDGEARARTLVVWCPDWPTVTALKERGLPLSTPAAVFSGNRVFSCTQSARLDGVRIGMRRREAESRCAGITVLKVDAERDARLFEAVAAVVEEIAPGVEILRSGMVACPARGPARYFGSEQRAAEKLVDAVESLDVECRIGIADVLPVAVLAARHSTFVPPGESAAFCAALPIEELGRDAAISPPDRVELIDLLKRLGIRTVGEFAALPEVKVVTRFGADGAVAHRLAQGRAERGLSRRHIPAELVIEEVCDPPLDRVDTAAFLARALADRFHNRLAAAGLACTRLQISAHTEQGNSLSRTWRCATPLTPAATADRLRWQLDGWLTSRTKQANGRRGHRGAEDSDDHGTGPGAITLLKLEPVEAVDAGLIQYGLWGSAGEEDERASWALARVQGLLGPDSVVSPVLSGGRGVTEQITLLPWGQEKVEEREPGAPWPGRLPAPSPTRLPPIRQPATAPPAALLSSSTASGSTASGSIASGSTASGSIASGSAASGSAASGSTASGSTASGSIASGSAASGTPDSGTAGSAGSPDRYPNGRLRQHSTIAGEVPAPGLSIGGSAAGRHSAVGPSPARADTRLLDDHGQTVEVSDRGFLSSLPRYLESTGKRHRVSGWAGPWLYDERWWLNAAGDPAPSHVPQARVQLLIEDGPALLLGYGRGRWQIEGVYD